MRLHDPAGPGLLTQGAADAGERLRRAARRRPLRARRDDGGARLRHDRHRRADVRAAARRDRAAPGSLRARDRRADRPACGRARPTTRRRSDRGSIPGLHWATGHYRHGILLAPITAQIVGCSARGRRGSGARGGVRAGALRRRDESAPARLGARGDRHRQRRAAAAARGHDRRVARRAARVAPEARGVAVALDGEVVPRARWQQTELPDGARIEVVAAVQGG